jgi:uncharacterized protein YndB with AHSA1/START domain
MSDLGTATMLGDGTRIQFERRYAHPIERVWAAITTPDDAIAWWGKLVADLTVGGKFVVEWENTDDEGNRAVMHGVITAFDPPRLLEVEGDIHGTLRFELVPEHDGTRLTFTSTLVLPDEFRTKVLAGWHFHLDALGDALQGEHIDWPNWPKDRWEAIHEKYRSLA